MALPMSIGLLGKQPQHPEHDSDHGHTRGTGVMRLLSNTCCLVNMLQHHIIAWDFTPNFACRVRARVLHITS